eukprot:TRINITY_DN19136_c0_g1_i1.p1 TRINITY_DN19136_c0_g1~~TRINITY_DN19136_c0_g1_i1.p1  ORF type:complete len:423 (+),score=31.67 TRINITY_DN19136_c0_g1_i1:603-1871(+)
MLGSPHLVSVRCMPSAVLNDRYLCRGLTCSITQRKMWSAPSLSAHSILNRSQHTQMFRPTNHTQGGSKKYLRSFSAVTKAINLTGGPGCSYEAERTISIQIHDDFCQTKAKEPWPLSPNSDAILAFFATTSLQETSFISDVDLSPSIPPKQETSPPHPHVSPSGSRLYRRSVLSAVSAICLSLYGSPSCSPAAAFQLDILDIPGTGAIRAGKAENMVYVPPQPELHPTSNDSSEMISALAGRESSSLQERQEREPRLLSYVSAEPAGSGERPRSFQKLDKGVQALDIREGGGEVPQIGDKVAIHYYARLAAKQGWRFDSTYDHKDGEGVPMPFEFVIGSPEVISGLSLGVQSMHVGGTRRLVIPPSQGYQSTSDEPIPPNFFDRQRLYTTIFNATRLQNGEGDTLGTLVFDVQLLGIRQQAR